jgi:DnaJ-class molecular chaperone
LSIKVATTEISIKGETALSNYSEVFDAWDEEEGVECPDCKGTGLDRDEIYDCLTCYGEGIIVPLDTALGVR